LKKTLHNPDGAKSLPATPGHAIRCETAQDGRSQRGDEQHRLSPEAANEKTGWKLSDDVSPVEAGQNV